MRYFGVGKETSDWETAFLLKMKKAHQSDAPLKTSGKKNRVS